MQNIGKSYREKLNLQMRGENHMDNLIKVANRNGDLVVSSREVAVNFDKEHKHILRDIENIQSDGVAQNWADLFIETEYQHEQNKQFYREYLLTRDGFSLLAMGFTGKKALEWKLKYIEVFNKMEQKLKEQNNLKLDSKFMYQIAQQLEEKENQIAIMAPKALFADAVSTSKSTVLVGELAKILKQNGIEDMGQNRLFTWLRDNGFLIRRKGSDYNMPTQKSMELGLFRIKETSITHSDGHISVNKTPKVTGKGQIYFVNKFKEREIA